MTTKKILTNLAIIFVALIMIGCAGRQNQPTAAQGVGAYQVLRTPAADLDDMQAALNAIDIASAVGIGRSAYEMNARSAAVSHGRNELAASVQSIVRRITETYMMDVAYESRQMFENGTRTLVDQRLDGARAERFITTRNPETGRFTIYALVVLDPATFRNAVATSLEQNIEFENRARHEAIMERFETSIAEYRRTLGGR